MANKAKNFQAETDFEYNTYFLKHGNDEVTMTLSTTGVEFKKGAEKIESPTYSTLKLYETASGNAADNTDISLSEITMKRAKSKFKNSILNSLIIITQILSSCPK